MESSTEWAWTRLEVCASQSVSDSCTKTQNDQCGHIDRLLVANVRIIHPRERPRVSCHEFHAALHPGGEGCQVDDGTFHTMGSLGGLLSNDSSGIGTRSVSQQDPLVPCQPGQLGITKRVVWLYLSVACLYVTLPSQYILRSCGRKKSPI